MEEYLVRTFELQGVHIRLFYGDIHRATGDLLLLPLNQNIMDLEAITFEMVSRAGPNILRHLEQYAKSDDKDELDMCAMFAGLLPYRLVFFKIIPDYQVDARNDETYALLKLSSTILHHLINGEKHKSLVAVSPVLGLDKGFPPALCAEAVLHSLLRFFDDVPDHRYVKFYSIYSMDLDILDMMDHQFKLMLYPDSTHPTYIKRFRIQKNRTLEPLSEAVVIIVSRQALEDIRNRVNTNATDEYRVEFQSTYSIQLTDVKREQGRTVNDVVYIASPQSKNNIEYKVFLKSLMKELKTIFKTPKKQISVAVDFDGAFEPDSGKEIFTEERFDKFLVKAVKRLTESLAVGEDRGGI